MIKFLYKFKYIYVLVYSLILYAFFVSLSFKGDFFRRYLVFDPNQKELIQGNLTLGERKFFLDFKYKSQVNPSMTKRFTEDLIFLDNECRILGCKSVNYQDHLSTKFTFYLNKKFVYSFFYGSIKFIKL